MNGIATRSLLFASVFFFANFINAQQTDATILFKDGKKTAVSLNETTFKNDIRLVNSVTNEDIPLESVAEVFVNGQIYVPHQFVLNLDRRLNKTDSLVVEQIDTLLLLQKILGGSISLFHHTDHLDNEHIFIHKNGELQELVRWEYMRNSKIGYKDLYKGVLRLYLSDCEALKKHNYDFVSFSLSDFKKLAKRYNKSCGQLSYEAKTTRNKIHGGLMGGYQYHYSAFKEDFVLLRLNHFSYISLNEVSTHAPIIGAFIQVPLGKRSDRLMLEFTPYLTPGLSFNKEQRIYGTYDTIDASFSFKAHYYNMVLGLRYTFPGNNPDKKFYASFGVGLKYLLATPENYLTAHVYRRPSTDYIHSRKVFQNSELPKNSTMFRAKAGLRIKRLDLGLSLAYGGGGLTVYNIERHKALGLELSYRLF